MAPEPVTRRQIGITQTLLHHLPVLMRLIGATGIAAYLLGGGTVESAQQIAKHKSPRTTKLYDQRGDKVTLDEIDRINL